MKAFLVALLALTCAFAQAGELIVHGPSVHSAYNTDQLSVKQGVAIITKRYDNRNYGIGYRTTDGYLFGVYNNSYSRPAAYFGRQFMFNSYVGAFAAVATGYNNVSGYPLGGLVVRIPLTGRTSLELMGSPKLGKIDGLLHAAIAYKF